MSPESTALVITESGISPTPLKLKPDEGLVFFLNQTANQRLNVEIDFGATKKHCWSTNMRSVGSGTIRTAKALAPGDFVTACFPEAGTYAVRVFGQSPDRAKRVAKIVVE